MTVNMDISTGHMILSYMEDHLRNKDRLEKEWESLCSYEPDPCTCITGRMSLNQRKNRYPEEVLPFDHSRVILNDLSNPNKSDYINANTIVSCIHALFSLSLFSCLFCILLTFSAFFRSLSHTSFHSSSLSFLLLFLSHSYSLFLFRRGKKEKKEKIGLI